MYLILLFVSVSGYPHLEQGTGKYSAFLKMQLYPNSLDDTF
jgi:hypothetical protein